MKHINEIAIFLAAASVLACNPDKPVGPVTPEPPKPETHTLTFIMPEVPDSLSKTVWEPGDQIVVHGEYAANQVVVTLESGDISPDGKTATRTVDGLYPYVRKDCESTLYAEYPASAVDNLKHCFFYSKFSTTSEQILAACNDGDTFRFSNICGALKFKVDGDFDAYEITGLKKETLGYEFLQVKLTNEGNDYLQYKGAPVITMTGAVNDGEAVAYMPVGVMMSGCKIKLKSGDNFTNIFKYTNPVCINRGIFNDLGDITGELDVYVDPFSGDIRDADKDGNANCYIITEPGTYKFKAVMGNNATAFFTDAAEASVLWETVCTDVAPAAGTLVQSVSYAEDYMIFTMPETLTPGNAVIALNDADGKILWSWHIWVPATEIKTVGGLFNTPMMDRHLGALTVSGNEGPVDPLSFGMMYQWGRKDPYVNSAALSSSSPAAVTGVQVEKAPATITLSQSIANPTLMGHTDNGDWLTDVDGTLWLDDHKTVYDPCPAGYRVPSSSANNFWGDLASRTGWSFDKTLGWFTVGSPASVFPLAGYRDDYSVESITHNYDRALIWSSCTSDLTSKPGYGRGNDIRPGSSISFKDVPKSRCGSVRCVME